MADPSPKNAGILSSIFAIIAFIILIIIVIWGLVHLAGLTGDWFSRFFGGKPSTNAITVTAPKETVSGEPFTVTWRYPTSVKGSYALLYQCKSDLKLKAAPRTDAQSVSVPCGAAYTIGAATSVSLTAITKSASTTLPLSIIFLPASTSTAQAQGSAMIIVHASTGAAQQNIPASNQQDDAGTGTSHPAEQTTAESSATQTGTDTEAGAQETPRAAARPARTATPPQLSVEILQVGVIDPSTGTISNRLPSSPNDVVAVEFDIANHGGSTSGSYYFDAQLPTTGTGYYYQSPAQEPLHPGDHIVNILRFTQMNPGGGTFSVRADPTHTSGDADASDNVATRFISYNYGAYYPQGYQPYYQN